MATGQSRVGKSSKLSARRWPGVTCASGKIQGQSIKANAQSRSKEGLRPTERDSREPRSRNHDIIWPSKVGQHNAHAFHGKCELRATTGSYTCIPLDTPFSFERIPGICSLLDSDAVDEVRSHGAERRDSPTLHGVHKLARRGWRVLQILFFPLHSFILGGGGNSAIRAGFARFPLQNGCPGLGRKLVGRSNRFDPIRALESEQDSVG
jgi:hypothetical protein